MLTNQKPKLLFTLTLKWWKSSKVLLSFFSVVAALVSCCILLHHTLCACTLRGLGDMSKRTQYLINTSELSAQWHLQFRGLKNVKIPTVMSESQSYSTIKTSSLPSGDRQLMQRSLISLKQSLHVCVCFYRVCVCVCLSQNLKYVPDFSNTHLLHLCWLTNYHSAQSSFIFVNQTEGWRRDKSDDQKRSFKGG